MLVVAGLGNPGKEYAGTKHNIGFRVVSSLADKYNLSGDLNSKFNAIVAKGSIKGVDTMIVEPLTFMNLSGNSILKILNWYKVEAENLVVVYDEINLNLGRIRLRKGGSDGGHNGIKSIITVLGGNENFYRLRVGIGPGPTGDERVGFVLSRFAKEQEKLLKDSVNLAVNALETFISEGFEASMNKFNGVDLTRSLSKSKRKAFSSLFIDTSWSNIEKEGQIINSIENEITTNTIFPINIECLKKGLTSEQNTF